MVYSQKTTVKDEHIDFQGIVDGLYYPFYMEKVRHDFIKEVYGIDIVKAAEEGAIYVLVSYEIKFKNSLKQGEEIKVTCELKPISALKFGFYQQIISNGKVCAEAEFVSTCIDVNSNRPFIPEELKKVLANISESK